MVWIPSLCSKDDQTAKPRSIKWPQALITTPKLYESWKICHGRKIYCLVERSAACNTAVLRARLCPCRRYSKDPRTDAGGECYTECALRYVNEHQTHCGNTQISAAVKCSVILKVTQAISKGGDFSIFWLLLILPVRQHQCLVLKNFLSIYPLLPPLQVFYSEKNITWL